MNIYYCDESITFIAHLLNIYYSDESITFIAHVLNIYYVDIVCLFHTEEWIILNMSIPDPLISFDFAYKESALVYMDCDIDSIERRLIVEEGQPIIEQFVRRSRASDPPEESETNNAKDLSLMARSEDLRSMDAANCATMVANNSRLMPLRVILSPGMCHTALLQCYLE